MSLYTDDEICTGCKYAEFHSCGKCLKSCLILKHGEVDRYSGKCKFKEKEESN